MAFADSRQRLRVRAGRARAALDAEGVAEVIGSPRLTRVPLGPPGLLGVTHLRGLVLPVVSLGALLGEEDVLDLTRVVVLRRDPPLGLAVSSIEALETWSQAETAPSHGQLLLADESGTRWFDLDAALQDRFAAFRVTRRSGERQTLASPVAAAEEPLAFLGFHLAGQAYALPLDAVAEVTPAPKALVALPHTEEVLCGVFELRGSVLPVVSLRTLLGLEPRAVQAQDRVVVVQIGDQRLALLVDGVSAILRAPVDAIGAAPSLFNRGAGEARIDSILRLGEARGLVSILAAEQVLADERVSRLLAQAEGFKEETMTSTTAATRRERFLVVQLGEETYGLPLAAVDEVVRLPAALTRLPRAPDYVQGVMSLRSRVIPVIDQRRRFSVAGEAVGQGRRVVVVTLGALQAGFAVDAVTGILEVAEEDLLPAPELSADGDRLFDRAARREGQGDVILLIDPRALLDRAEADLLRDLTAGPHAS